MVPCESVYNCILGRPFLTPLDALASTIHLNMKYHNCFDEPTIIQGDLRRAHLIHETISKDPDTIIFTLKRKIHETLSIVIDTLDLNMHEDETMSSDESNSPVGTKLKNLRPILDRNFEVV